MMQVMRFAVEEINNSTLLLPDVSLGYETYDYCSDTRNFPAVFDFFSSKGLIKVKRRFDDHQPKVISLTGPYGSTRTITIAPLFMLDLIPMVNYGSSSYDLSNKRQFPSFLRAVPSNKDLIQIIINIIQWFRWNWVAFIGSQDDYSQDGLNRFYSKIKETGICLAYQESLGKKSNYRETLNKIKMLNVNVIVIFAVTQYAEEFIKAAIQNNIRDKVWIAGETWSMNQQLPREPGIERIGTIIGITERLLTLPGFSDFIYKSRGEMTHLHSSAEACNQSCEKCSSLSPEDIISENPTFSFAIYSATYTMAHALHKVLQCDTHQCDKNKTVYPYMLLKVMKKSDFPLLDRHVRFDENGDPPVSYAIVLWLVDRNPPEFQMIGTYDTYPRMHFNINSSLVRWTKNGSAPFSNCSVECSEGFMRRQDGFHECCFQCQICPPNTSINSSLDPYTCTPCRKEEWSEEGSTSCKKRRMEYLHFTEPVSILLMFFAVLLIVVSVAISILFAYNYNTPVVRSAGGNMCFLMLAGLSVCSISVFFFFDQPTAARCVMRDLPFVFFYTVVISCMAVRSFQIVCIFKMAAKLPKAHSWWVKHNGQWLFVGLASLIQFIGCVVRFSVGSPKPYNDDTSFQDQIVQGCDLGATTTLVFVSCFTALLSALCFVFSYMGTDLPKNYNEAKSITFSLLLFSLSWLTYFTAYLMVHTKYIQVVNVIAQLASLYSILFSYFIPKSYIIMCQAEKNTQEYFQTTIQSYTQTISRM
ncbi:taste receptor type 1 member 2.2 [Chanos chanos]|uniref:Taste receptor type 1 member 2.2 n=1 Tax=Chanos chanos TaxID=29144 RepID=A0A6J2W8K0_CHACN|nr:taste receptor type 1 member 1-like [Chanos chanos]